MFTQAQNILIVRQIFFDKQEVDPNIQMKVVKKNRHFKKEKEIWS